MINLKVVGKCRTVVKRFVKEIASGAGYEISKRYDAEWGTIRLTLADFVTHLCKLGFNPATVIDVGVASGTPELYEGFPQSKHLLIDPLEEFMPDIQRLMNLYNMEFICAAAGANPGKAILHVHPTHLEGSSLFSESDGPEIDGEPREVEVQTLDEICKRTGASGPMLLKVDVQGAEIEVLRGAEQTLRQTEVMVLECSLFRFQKEGLELAEVFAFAKELGWAPYDIFGFRNRPLDGALAQVDIAFVKERGLFRSSHRYATREQRVRMGFPKDDQMF